MNNPKRDILDTNAYAKFKWNPFINTKVIERKRNADGRMDVQTTDRRTDRRADTRTANVRT